MIGLRPLVVKKRQRQKQFVFGWSQNLKNFEVKK